MIRTLVLCCLLLLTGCSPPPPPAASVDRSLIFINQRWSEATAVARNAGYELHDASLLAMDPTPDGFYIDLPQRRGLLVFRDAGRNVVEAINWVENWPGAKKARVSHAVESFVVPPAEPK